MVRRHLGEGFGHRVGNLDIGDKWDAAAATIRRQRREDDDGILRSDHLGELGRRAGGSQIEHGARYRQGGDRRLSCKTEERLPEESGRAEDN
jgi:hypothetical protein